MWPPNRAPKTVNGRVETWHFLGHWWSPIYGNPLVVQGRFAVEEASGRTRDQQWQDALDYISGSPGGPTGTVATAYACLWGRLAGLPVRKAGIGAKKSWADLSAQTKRGYRGRMRSAYGIGKSGWTGQRYRNDEDRVRAETEFRRFYQSADDLRFLRRHATAGVTRVNPGQSRLVGSRIARGEPPAFVTTWAVK